jgi:hypothetical protein
LDDLDDMDDMDDMDDLGDTAFPEPGDVADPATLLLRLLDFYRATAVRKVGSLRADQVRRSWVPTAWTPLELLSHLAHMEQRWIVWGFLGEEVPDPWGDETDDRWHVPQDVSVDDVVALLRATGDRTRQVLADHRLTETGAVGGRFATDPPTLASIGFHVLQEYARHVGHLDIATELAGGHTGE